MLKGQASHIERVTEMTTRKSLFLAAILGLIALIIGAALLLVGREAREINNVKTAYQPQYVDGAAMVRFVETLASDALQGRATGTPGNEAARGFILKRYEQIGLSPFGEQFEQSFTIENVGEENGPKKGTNVVGWMPGETPGEGPVLVVTAHFDHLGILDGEIYNGADDNASGVSAMIAIAHHMKENSPRHDIIFAALDAEEIGLLGAVDLVRRLQGNNLVSADRIALNINLDMVGRSAVSELYVAGTHHTPDLSTLFLDEVISKAPVTLIKGHDRLELGNDDWSLQSDHGEFFLAGIPFLYFGVEDHEGNHSPLDEVDALTLDFYVRAADSIAMAVMAADAELNAISALRD